VKASYILAGASWVSVFALSWLIVLEQVGIWPAGMFLAFFFAIAAITSMVIYGRESGGRDGAEERGH